MRCRWRRAWNAARPPKVPCPGAICGGKRRDFPWRTARWDRIAGVDSSSTQIDVKATGVCWVALQRSSGLWAESAARNRAAGRRDLKFLGTELPRLLGGILGDDDQPDLEAPEKTRFLTVQKEHLKNEHALHLLRLHQQSRVLRGQWFGSISPDFHSGPSQAAGIFERT